MNDDFTSIFYMNKNIDGREILTHAGSSIQLFMGLNDNVMFVFKRPDGQETYLHLGIEAALAMCALIIKFDDSGCFESTMAKIKELREDKHV